MNVKVFTNQIYTLFMPDWLHYSMKLLKIVTWNDRNLETASWGKFVQNHMPLSCEEKEQNNTYQLIF